MEKGHDREGSKFSPGTELEPAPIAFGRGPALSRQVWSDNLRESSTLNLPNLRLSGYSAGRV